jgi:hypothetical protein
MPIKKIVLMGKVAPNYFPIRELVGRYLGLNMPMSSGHVFC